MKSFSVHDNPYPENFKPKALIEKINGDRTLIRFNDLYDACYWDYLPNQEKHGINSSGTQYAEEDSYYNEQDSVSYYMKNRFIMTPKKIKLLEQIQRELKVDKSFNELIHKAKTDKRTYLKNKFSGNLSMVDFAKRNDKMFSKSKPGAKKSTLNLAFQVGTFAGGDYSGSVVKITKTVLMCQALGISLNIDLFDSDTNAANGRGYTIINVANSFKKLNFTELFVFYHRAFFRYTLFNSYLQLGKNSSISSFLDESVIIRDLSERYDIIGGNMVNKELSQDSTVSRIIKIAELC
jgi:hypothetical protein